MAVAEFDLIKRFFASLPQHGRGVGLGIGDDCALLEVPDGQQLAVSIDTLVEGTHFLPGIPAEQLAYRALGACVSDLAAMGAEPAWLTLALTLPESDPDWLEGFSRGLGEGMARYGLSLVGGDTTRGHRALSLQVHGWVPKGKALTRRGAQPGDSIWVSGTLGDAMAGLDQLQTQADQDPYLLGRFYRPSARIELGLALREIASAALDISDGLLADLSHLLQHQDLGAELQLAQIPLSDALLDRYPEQQALNWALGGGEDFELCFCVPANRRQQWLEKLPGLSVSCREIGAICRKPGLIGVDRQGNRRPMAASGYQHF
ncbi:thiamine-phosphate kinase [Motiliproteus sp.]|uniref:thiamine-phosphate kinase n=1 Tax=Motiliproteus sp. TaxID=1898955 RepID=UPI003BA9618D